MNLCIERANGCVCCDCGWRVGCIYGKGRGRGVTVRKVTLLSSSPSCLATRRETQLPADIPETEEEKRIRESEEQTRAFVEQAKVWVSFRDREVFCREPTPTLYLLTPPLVFPLLS